MLKPLVIARRYVETVTEITRAEAIFREALTRKVNAIDTAQVDTSFDEPLHQRLIALRARRQALAEVLELDHATDTAPLDLDEPLPTIAVSVQSVPQFPDCWFVRIPRQYSGAGEESAFNLSGTSFLIYRRWLDQLVTAASRELALSPAVSEVR